MNSDVDGSFERFFREEYSSLVAFGSWLTGDFATGEDLAQVALNTAHRRWHRIHGYDKPGGFTRRVMVNLASNERRRRKRERKALKRLATASESRSRSSGGDDPDASLPTEYATLWREINLLPAQQRAAVALTYVDGLSAAEVAEVLGCAEATVRVHLHRARGRLADRLEDETEHPRLDDPDCTEEVRR